MKKRILVFVIIIGFLIGGAHVVNSAQDKDSNKSEIVNPGDNNFYEQIELLTDTLTMIQSDYVEEITAKELIYGALKGMLGALDPYSQFLEPEDYADIRTETEGEFGGLGIEITIKDGLLTIITPLDDTPAYKVGLQAGDRIVRIEGESTRDITLMEAVKKLRGDPGSKITITILREKAHKIMDVSIIRAIIKLESVKNARVVEEGIGYIRLTSFQERSAKDFDKEMKRLKKEGIEGLVFDLRNNSGGLLSTSIEICERFIGKDKLIVSTKGRLKNQDFEFRSSGKYADEDVLLVVLINEGSASASEIVAGCLKDHQRAILLGEKSFGKGSVQTVVPLKDNSAVRLTTSRYFTPSGQSIHEKGIEPDIEVVYEYPEEEEEENGEARKIFDQVDEVEDVDKEGVELVEEKEEEEEKKLIMDNQLVRAIDLIKGLRVYRAKEETETVPVN